ncbi:hypothetical protein [Vibrio sp. F74]|uniref:hypothetical protein n=1 Tax=Vibrio sp. F74 TaxID=700020 RepID=UPI0035F5F568
MISFLADTLDITRDGRRRYQFWDAGIEAPLSPQDVYNRPLNKKGAPTVVGAPLY